MTSEGTGGHHREPHQSSLRNGEPDVAGDTFSLRLSPELHRQCVDRQIRWEKASLAALVREDLETFHAALRAELARIPLTVDTALALARIVPAHAAQQVPGPLLVGLLVDERSAAARRGENWDSDHRVDGQKLVDTLAALGPTADLALRDAFLRWHQTEGAIPTAESFAACGLRITDTPDREGPLA